MTGARTGPRVWPAEGSTRVPYWAYTAPDVYERERTNIFEGDSWAYVGLDAEIPNVGDYKTTFIGDIPVIVSRDRAGDVHVLRNKCAHRGVQVARLPYGNASKFECPYHQWTYRSDGRLLGVPFKNGVLGHGGMPDDFENADHGLEALRVAERHGVVFASFGHPEPLDEYLGGSMLTWFDRVFDGRQLRVLGTMKQRIPANWKLMFENIKDPYHASLLHVFLVSFGLFRADNPSSVAMDPTGRHSVLVSARRTGPVDASVAGEMAALRVLELEDKRLLDIVKEFDGPATVVMQTLWPNLIIQQQVNTLATRHIVPRGPDAFDLLWTFFGYESDDEAMTERRLRHANFMGPAGFVSLDDSEVMYLAQNGAHADDGTGSALVEMGGRSAEDTDHMVTEAALRAFYNHYRKVMGL